MLEDFRTAPIDEGLRATLGLLEKLTLTPAEILPADVDLVRAQGVSDEAIRDAMYVAYLFAMYNRAGDTLGFDTPADPEDYRKMAGVLLFVGYR